VQTDFIASTLAHRRSALPNGVAVTVAETYESTLQAARCRFYVGQAFQPDGNAELSVQTCFIANMLAHE